MTLELSTSTDTGTLGDFHGDEASDLIHDPWLTCVGKELSRIAAETSDWCQQRHVTAQRRPRKDAVERRRCVIDNLIANLVVLVHHWPPKNRLAISLKHDTKTRYDRQEFSPRLVHDTLLGLEQFGIIIRHLGVRNQSLTSIEPSTRFRRRLSRPISIVDVGRTSGGETIILRAGSESRGAPKALIDYSDTIETERLRGEMAIINANLRSVNITVDGLPMPPIRLTRRFQIPSLNAPHTFNLHGRLYGGFWINMQRAERHRIRIDGEELADLDFTAMFTQLAYLHAGLPVPQGDPYSGIEGMAGMDAPAELQARQRDAVKRGLNAFFFRTGRMQRLPPEVKRLLGVEWNATRFAEAIRKRHAPIRHLFGKGLGLSFMWTESSIMVRCLLKLAAVDVVALPIHDGLLVRRSCVHRALAAMGEASMEVTGVELPVKLKDLAGQEGVGSAPALHLQGGYS